MPDKNRHQSALIAAKDCIEKASRYFSIDFNLPLISYQLRGKAAGKAYLQLWEIRLNPILFRENPQIFLDQVIPHEIAHLVVFQLFGKVKPHGKKWQQVMNQVFHCPATTTHNLNIESVMGKHFTYQCNCQTHELSLRRHNKIQRQQAAYYCKKCQALLKFTENQSS